MINQVRALVQVFLQLGDGFLFCELRKLFDIEVLILDIVLQDSVLHGSKQLVSFIKLSDAIPATHLFNFTELLALIIGLPQTNVLTPVVHFDDPVRIQLPVVPLLVVLEILVQSLLHGLRLVAPVVEHRVHRVLILALHRVLIAFIIVGFPRSHRHLAKSLSSQN